MKTYRVTVRRTSYSERIIEVEAKSEVEAHEKAINEAGDYEFSEHNADYEVDYIEECTRPKRGTTDSKTD